MFNLLFFAFNCAVFYALLKYRVSITIEKRSSHRASGEDRKAVKGAVTSGPSPESEIASALVGLGVPKAKAKLIAAEVVGQGGGFDDMLRKAIQLAAKKAA